MGFIRGGLLILVSSLLFFSLLIGNASLTLTSSLEYENVKSELSSSLEELTKEEYCQGNQTYIVTYKGYEIEVPCEILPQTPESILDEVFNNSIEEIYYSQYDCNFWDCFEKTNNPLFLISQKARDYWKETFFISLLVSLILIILTILLMEKKINLPILIGILIIMSSLPLLIFRGIFSSSKSLIFQIISLFFSQSYNVFIVMIIIGITILALGIAIKLFGFGFKLFHFVNKIQEKAKTKTINKIQEKAKTKTINKIQEKAQTNTTNKIQEKVKTKTINKINKTPAKKSKAK